MKRLMLKTLAAAVAISAFGVAFAQEKTIKFTTQNPKGHPLVMGMEKFAEIVQAKSGGKIKVNLFPGGVLGGDAAVVSAMQGGHDRDGLDELRHPGQPGQGLFGL